MRGTRIAVSLILESLAAGMSVTDIVDAYPSLTDESVRGTLLELAHKKELLGAFAFQIKSLKGHKVLTPVISQSDVAEDIFGRL